MNSFLYRAFNSDGDLLYVGITTDPKTRFRDHGIDKSWWNEVTSMTMEVLPSWDDAVKAETLAIATESPRYNKHPGNQGPVTREKKVHQPRTYQALPDSEVEYLRSLPDHDTVARAFELYRQGWSIKAILQGVSVTPSSSWLVNQFGFHVPEPTGAPLPELPLSPTAQRIQDRKRKKEGEELRLRLLLGSAEKARLRELAKIVSTYRPNHTLTHPTTIAVGQYNQLLRDLKKRGVRTQDLADAAGVNESNIRRRLKD